MEGMEPLPRPCLLLLLMARPVWGLSAVFEQNTAIQ